jgi:hypothetical protein
LTDKEINAACYPTSFNETINSDELIRSNCANGLAFGSLNDKFTLNTSYLETVNKIKC